jgi:amino acid permease
MSNTANNGLSAAERGADIETVDHEESGLPPARPLDASSVASEHGKLHRGLSARQVQMIAIAGTIGTGLFLGTGKALATGGPASMLICYAVVAVVVYVTLLLLGEMATQYPVAGQNLTCFGSPCFEAADPLVLTPP